jgi:hypothetical protein
MKLVAVLGLVALSAQAQAPALGLELVTIPRMYFEALIHTHEEYEKLQKKIDDLRRGTNCV